MTLTPKVVDALIYTCAIPACAALMVQSMPLRGWVALCAFGLMGVVLIVDRAAPNRGARMVLGVFLMLAGVSFGLPKI